MQGTASTSRRALFSRKVQKLVCFRPYMPWTGYVLEAPGVGLEPTTLRLTVECSA